MRGCYFPGSFQPVSDFGRSPSLNLKGGAAADSSGMTREPEALRPLIEPNAHLSVCPANLNEVQQDRVESMPISL